MTEAYTESRNLSETKPGFENGRQWGVEKLKQETRERYQQTLCMMKQCRCQPGTPIEVYWKDFVSGAEDAMEAK
jgi:hypothetical protein